MSDLFEADEETVKRLQEQLIRDTEVERISFQEKVYRRFFASQIRHTGEGFGVVPNTKSYDEVFERHPNAKDDYKDLTISAIWYGWRLRMNFNRPVITGTSHPTDANG